MRSRDSCGLQVLDAGAVTVAEVCRFRPVGCVVVTVGRRPVLLDVLPNARVEATVVGLIAVRAVVVGLAADRATVGRGDDRPRPFESLGELTYSFGKTIHQ